MLFFMKPKFFYPAALLAMSLYIVGGIFSAPFHADEADHLSKARDYVVYFVIGQPGLLRVDPPVAIHSEAYNRLLTGTVNAYLTGFILWHTGTPLDSWPPMWYYPQTVAENRAAGRWPSESVLHRGRLASALLTAGGVWLIASLGNRIAGRSAGFFCALLYTLHPTILLNGRRGMQEGTLMFFCLLSVWLALRTLDKPTPFRAALLGIALGLALASKLTALLTLVAVLIALLLPFPTPGFVGTRFISSAYRLFRKPEKPVRDVSSLTIRTALMTTIIPLTTAAGIYLLLTPAIWSNPLDRSRLAAELRAQALQGQTRAAPDAYDNILERPLGLLHQPMQYYESPDFADDPRLKAEIAAYDHSLWRGITFPWPLGIALAIIGIISLPLSTVERGPGGEVKNTSSPLVESGSNLSPSPQWRGVWGEVNPQAHLILLWLLITALGLLLSVPLAWTRYYLPWIVPLVLLMGLGLDICARAMQAYALNLTSRFLNNGSNSL
jgi:hypothetical protein